MIIKVCIESLKEQNLDWYNISSEKDLSKRFKKKILKNLKKYKENV